MKKQQTKKRDSRLKNKDFFNYVLSVAARFGKAHMTKSEIDWLWEKFNEQKSQESK